MKKLISLGIILIIVLVSALIFWPNSEEKTESAILPNQNQNITRNVEVIEAQPQLITQSISYHGSLAPKSRVYIVPKANGRVANVLVEVGQRVEEGEVIIELEFDEARLQAAQAKASADSAQANLARIKAGARPEEIEQAQAALTQAQANYEQAKQNHQRSQKLHEQGVLSTNEWEGVQTQYQVVKSQLVSAEKSLELIIQGATAEDIQAAKASLAQAEAARDLAYLQVKNAKITTPISGYIVNIDVEKGTMAGASAPVASVVETSIVKLPLEVSGRDVVRLEKGQKALLTLDAIPGDEIVGEITSISPAADQASGLFPVTLEFINEGMLRPGLHASAKIVLEEKEDSIVIPTRALTTRGQTDGVFVVEQNIAHFTPIETGITQGSQIEIKSGLAIGDLVVVVGHNALTDGLNVEISQRRDF